MTLNPLRAPPRLRPLALVPALALAAYANSFAVPFQFDDLVAIAGNPAVASLEAFLAAPSRGRPLAYLTFALNGSLSDGSVVGYHAVNLAIHVLTALGVYALTLLLARRADRPGGPSSPPWRAGLVASLLFVVHPLHTQAVTYVTQRMASLAALLFVGAVLAYLSGAVARTLPRRLLLQAAALLLAYLAYETKENTATLPAVLLLAEALLLDGGAARRLLRASPQLLLSAGVWLVGWGGTGAVAAATGGAFLEWTPPPGLPAGVAYLLAQPGVLLRYLRLLLLPIGQNLDHDVAVPSSPATPEVLLPVAALALLVVLPAGWAWRRRQDDPLARVVPFAAGWFLLTIAVESSVIPLADLMFEHRVYLPSVALFACAGLLLDRGLSRLRPGPARAGWAITAAVVLVLAVATWARNEVWRSPESLWSDVLAKSPRKARPYVQLAQAAAGRGAHREAVNLLERAVHVARPAPHVHLLLGLAHRSLGDLGAAEAALRRQQALGFGDFEGSHLALGLVLLETGRQSEACAHFDAEVRAHPANPDALENVGACRFAAGDVRGALDAWSRVAAAGNGRASVLFNLALAHAAMGEVAEAREAYERFLRAAGPELAPARQAAQAWLAQHPR